MNPSQQNEHSHILYRLGRVQRDLARSIRSTSLGLTIRSLATVVEGMASEALADNTASIDNVEKLLELVELLDQAADKAGRIRQ